MKYLFLIILFFKSIISFSQGITWYANVERLPNEHFEDFVYRIILEEQDLSEDDTTLPWIIVHHPVELIFGLSDESRIVFAFKTSDKDFIEIGMLTHVEEDIYSLESFGELSYSFPNSDEVISIFAFNVDIDIHPQKELCIIGKGEVKTIDEDGLVGCCDAMYQTDIFYEVEEKKYTTTYGDNYLSSFSFKNMGTFQGLNGLSIANEVKAAIHRTNYNSLMQYDHTIKIEKIAASHFEKLDSIDHIYGIESNSKIIDKIYKLDLGTGQDHFVVSFTRTVENIPFYSLGIFTFANNKAVEYIESQKLELNNYQNFKNYKVESIFSYDVDQFGDIKYKEIVVLLSADAIHHSEETKSAVFIAQPSYDNSWISMIEGWHYGIHEEKSAAEIKKAIEKFHKED